MLCYVTLSYVTLRYVAVQEIRPDYRIDSTEHKNVGWAKFIFWMSKQVKHTDVTVLYMVK